MSPRAVREGLGLVGAVLLAFGCAVAITWPMIQYTDGVVLGGGELGGWLWRYQWHFDSLEGLVASDLGPVDSWLAFVGLGRYPETGNILDVLGLSYPLQVMLGFPASYNAKVLIILTLNGVAGYAVSRYFSGSIAAAFAASSIAVVNPLTVLEVQECGLRQAVLWWCLLYPALLDRALRRRTLGSGLLAGACFGLAGAWYWFYGLFTAMFTVIWLIKVAVEERNRLRLGWWFRSVVALGLGVLLAAGPFIVAYAMREPGSAQTSADAEKPFLPEMSFFLPFPSYDTVSHAPLRPETYAENVLASINRTIGSSWSLTYAVDPRLPVSLPLTVLGLGVLPALARRRAWGWLAVWTVFYLGSLGPFLRIGLGDARAVYQLDGGYVVRLPYTWMFQFIPGMSRMFAPYRLSAYVMVASTVLVALALARLPYRAWLAPIVVAATLFQPMYRWGRGAVNEGGGDSREFRSPIKANRIQVPDYYESLDHTELSGIVELPLEQQQDLLYYYQIVHRQKVYRSWATPGAIPPFLRAKGTGGEAGERLRFLAQPDVVAGPVPRALDALSHHPSTAELADLTPAAVQKWGRTGNYRRFIVHERGYFLVDPQAGSQLYNAAVTRLAEQLQVVPVEHVELTKGDPANPVFGVPISGDLVPWTSQPADLPEQSAPSRFRMAVFELPDPAAEPAATEPAATEPAATEPAATEPAATEPP